MAKEKTLILLLILSAALLSCSQTNSNPPASNPAPAPPPVVESYALENTAFKNCHFADIAPSYSLNVPITPNKIQCDEGVAKKVELLTPAILPSGLSFSLATLSLVGTPSEKANKVPFDFYIENESGYSILHLTLTVK